MSKIPGTDGTYQSLLALSSPTITHHQGHVRTNIQAKPKIFKNLTLNETAMSEQSFADLSLMSGDISVQLLQGAKRMK